MTRTRAHLITATCLGSAIVYVGLLGLSIERNLPGLFITLTLAPILVGGYLMMFFMLMCEPPEPPPPPWTPYDPWKDK